MDASTVDVSGMMSSILGSFEAFSTDNLIAIFGAVTGVTAALALCWFGYNFAKRKVSGGLKKGKL